MRSDTYLLLQLSFLLSTVCKLKLLDYQIILTPGANFFQEIKQCGACFLCSLHMAGVDNFHI